MWKAIGQILSSIITPLFKYLIEAAKKPKESHFKGGSKDLRDKIDKDIEDSIDK